MKATLILTLILTLACQVQKPEKEYLGLDAQSVSELKKLISIEDKKTFRQEVDKLTKSQKFESVLILTHAMIELPWIEEEVPEFRTDRRMNKLYVERSLDSLVVAGKHDKLSAAYFRATLGRRGSVEETTKHLLEWTIKNKPNFIWDGDRFIVKEKDE